MASETKSKQIMARMTPATAQRLEEIATAMDRSVSWLLNDLAVKFIATQGKPAKRKSKATTVDTSLDFLGLQDKPARPPTQDELKALRLDVQGAPTEGKP